MLVFPGDLEEVEEIGCRGMHGDEVLVFGRNGVGKSGDLEVGRTLKIGCEN